jgi:oligoribonuclease
MNQAATDLLVWMDMEMSGLDPERERIIEVATILTDGQLNELAIGPELVIHQSEEILGAMDDWNKKHHNESGLVERVRQSTFDDAAAETAILAFLAQHVAAKERPLLAGSSIHQDRRFIHRYMPALDRRLHYRMVDVSSIKELCRRWYPAQLAALPPKRESHRALDDIRESIDELRYYRRAIFLPPPAAPPSPAAPPPPAE